jgi:hypothetical protein
MEAFVKNFHLWGGHFLEALYEDGKWFSETEEHR